MADYKITMNKSLDDVTAEQFTNICKFLGGSFGGSEGKVFTLKGAAKKPERRDVINAFAKQGISLSCTDVKKL